MAEPRQRIRIKAWDGAVDFEQPILVGLIVLVGLVLSGGCVDSKPIVASDSSWTLDEGGIVRASRASKQLALVFTGSAHGAGTAAILDALQSRSVKASFFVTGEYLAMAKHTAWLQRMVAEGHYLGPHAHGHLLYSPWEDRSQSLVTEQEFKTDLRRNLTLSTGSVH
jgi:peptidoglycan/xylan/chitin deacetylase (PgdA/CDA1 family)